MCGDGMNTSFSDVLCFLLFVKISKMLESVLGTGTVCRFLSGLKFSGEKIVE
jgi:hypothetical protein